MCHVNNEGKREVRQIHERRRDWIVELKGRREEWFQNYRELVSEVSETQS